MEKFLMGFIAKPKGIKGEVKINLTTSDNQNVLNLKKAYVGGVEMRIESSYFYDNNLFCRFKGIDSVEKADALRTKSFEIDRNDASELNEDEFYVADLIDAECFFENGKKFGKVKEILNYGASDIILFKTSRGEFMVPFVEDLIEGFDIDKKQLFVIEKRFMELSGCELTF